MANRRIDFLSSGLFIVSLFLSLINDSAWGSQCNWGGLKNPFCGTKYDRSRRSGNNCSSGQPQGGGCQSKYYLWIMNNSGQKMTVSATSNHICHPTRSGTTYRDCTYNDSDRADSVIKLDLEANEDGQLMRCVGDGGDLATFTVTLTGNMKLPNPPNPPADMAYTWTGLVNGSGTSLTNVTNQNGLTVTASNTYPGIGNSCQYGGYLAIADTITLPKGACPPGYDHIPPGKFPPKWPGKYPPCQKRCDTKNGKFHLKDPDTCTKVEDEED